MFHYNLFIFCRGRDKYSIFLIFEIENIILKSKKVIKFKCKVPIYFENANELSAVPRPIYISTIYIYIYILILAHKIKKF